MEKNEDLERVRVRCPQCQRPYSVEAHLIESTQPKFQCRTCQTGFTFDWPQAYWESELPTFPISQQVVFKAPLREPVVDAELPKDAKTSLQSDPAQETRTCPSCEVAVAVQLADCPSCGLNFLKHQEIQERRQEAKAKGRGLVEGPKELEEAWAKVLENWDDLIWQQSFIRACDRVSRLDFAAAKYKGILEVQPNDEIAIRMQNQVQAIAEAAVKVTAAPRRVPRRKFKTGGLTSLAILLALIVIAFGLSSPAYRNLVGLGASLFFISLFIRFFLR